MPVNWIETSDLSINYLLLLDRIQLSWMPGHIPKEELALVMQTHPALEWFLYNKCPEIAPWLDTVKQLSFHNPSNQLVSNAEQIILKTINDWLVYLVNPKIYDTKPFLCWDDKEILELISFSGKTVLDIGAGTGRLTFIGAKDAGVVFAVEPVENLRRYIKEKAADRGFRNIFPVDGLITEIPFPDHFADITMAGFVFGDEPAVECAELERVTKPGGRVILCPGSTDKETPAHSTLINHSYAWSRFETPGDGMKRKYWKVLPNKTENQPEI